jgi:protoporphyrinogen oxidase
VAAVFIYATLRRLFGARSSAAGQESLGYVRGGYGRILARFATTLRERGAVIRTATTVTVIEPAASATRHAPEAVTVTPGCRITMRGPEGTSLSETYDQVFFTAPARLARRVVADPLLPAVEAFERENPTAATYLGVACLVLALEKRLTPYYVLNIGEPAVELTGLIEMTNLIDPAAETGGLSLVYLPRYLDSESRELEADDEVLRDAMIERGLKRLFPDFDPAHAVYAGVHRARYVQPLPLVRAEAPPAGPAAPPLVRPFQIVNTAMLRCATLNNNEVVALVDRFMARNAPALA